MSSTSKHREFKTCSRHKLTRTTIVLDKEEVLSDYVSLRSLGSGKTKVLDKY